MKEIVYIHKDRFERRPPVISAVMILADLGYNVTLIDEGVSDNWKEILLQKGVACHEIIPSGKRDIVSKFMIYYLFKKKCSEILIGMGNPVIWVEGHPALFSLGSLINKYRHILQIQELHDTSKLFMKATRKVINSASLVFMPEYNRSVLYQVWFGMKKRAVVLPNKPYFIPSKDELSRLKIKYASLVEEIGEKKVFLYQGYLDEDRDISSVISAIKRMGDEYRVVLVGKDLAGMMEKYKRIDEKIVYIEYLPAPDYLLFTSMAFIGIMTYTPTHLNNVFCAPNKIFEYSAFGLPMIGNDIPGLKALEYEKAGEVADFGDEEGIFKSIKKLVDDYDTYSMHSRAFFERTDNKLTIKNALDKSNLFEEYK